MKSQIRPESRISALVYGRTLSELTGANIEPLGLRQLESSYFGYALADGKNSFLASRA
jgi:hypothetical protein